MKRNTWYECPTCKKSCDSHKEAEKCKQSHPVFKRESLLCPKCGTGFYVWRNGGEQLTIEKINQHIARNCDMVEKRGAE